MEAGRTVFVGEKSSITGITNLSSWGWDENSRKKIVQNRSMFNCHMSSMVALRAIFS
jgi:hypothetical protein